MKKTFLRIYLVLTAAAAVCGLSACGASGENSGESSVEETGTEETGMKETGTEENLSEGAFGEASMTELREAVVEALGEDYWPNIAADKEILSETYGISEEMYDDFLAEMPMISTNVDTMIIIKAKPGQEDAVEEALNRYRDTVVNDHMQYPLNIGKVQASRIEAFDSYICFIQLGGDVTDLVESGEDVVTAHCLEQNEKALEAIRTALTD